MLVIQLLEKAVLIAPKPMGMEIIGNNLVEIIN
jgi:hypothetical protein